MAFATHGYGDIFAGDVFLRKIMKNLKTMLKLAAATLLLFSSTAKSTVIDGVVLPGPNTPVNAAMGVVKQTVSVDGSMLSGYGVVTTFNGVNEDGFCPGCQLTFQYMNIMRVGPTGSSFSGGEVNIFVAPRSINIADIGDPGKFTMANTGLVLNGSLFLTLGVNGTFMGTSAGTGLASLLQLDVKNTGSLGAANGYFDTNSRLANADFSLNISSTIQPDQGPGTVSLGSANLFGATAPAPLPEPGSIALLGLGLLGVIANRKRTTRRI